MFSIQVQGLDRVQARIRNLPKQLRFAASRAINDVAYLARTAVITEMPRAFDRPTLFIQKSIWVGKTAKPESLQAWIYPRDPGGKSVDPADVLRAEVRGGPRKLKRSERAFQRVGILPAGYAMVPSKQLLQSDKADAYGNVKGSFIVQLLSYLQAFGEQGYKANMTAKNVGKLKAGGKKTQYGVEYFVSYGKLRSRNPNTDARQPLAAGIWSRTRTGFGSAVKPVFLFVRLPNYPARLHMGQIIQATVQAELPRRYATHLQSALATAR
jgi:hypothetical protein